MDWLRIHKLRTRFLIASCLLVATTMASGIFSILTFANLSQRMNETLLLNQEAIDLASSLSSELEREDDTLLLAIKADVEGARRKLAEQRNNFDRSYSRLLQIINKPEERTAADLLRAHVDSYRIAGDSFLQTVQQPGVHERYHLFLNPILRKAVSDCSQIQQLNFSYMKDAGIRAQEVANRSTFVVILVSIGALVVSIIVSFQLARSVEKPIRSLTESVDAIRHGDFDRRVEFNASDEIGTLADGFNRLAETLALFRRTNLSEVLKAKKTLESTLAALPDAVIVIRADGTFESLNERARCVLAAMGKQEATHVEEIDLPAAGVQAIHRAVTGEESVAVRWELGEAISLLIDGRQRKLLPISLPIPELSEGQRGAILVLYDVTDYARLDELRTELIAAASHELRTPLTTLRMNLLLLRESTASLPAREQEIIAGAITGCEELALTVDELLDLTRIEAQQLRLHFERINLAEVVGDVIAGLQRRFDDAGISTKIQIDSSEPFILRADPYRIRVVLTNLLDNALKYTSSGGEVIINLSSLQNYDSNADRLVQIAVTDSGSGIPPEFRDRVFERFFRIEHELSMESGNVKGAGIGLYLCKQIVQAHGGRISCQAGPDGIGTRFAVELPTGS